MRLWQRKIKASDIELVSAAETFADSREPALRVGCFVRLNSGGPTMMVVDHGNGDIIAAWRDRDELTHERRYPTACVHRVSIASCATRGIA